MENSNTILTFEEFVKQRETGDDSTHTQIGMTHDDIPATDSTAIDHDMTGDDTGTQSAQPAPAIEPNQTGTDHNIPVHMIDTTDGEAEAETAIEPNVQIEEPNNSTEK